MSRYIFTPIKCLIYIIFINTIGCRDKMFQNPWYHFFFQTPWIRLSLSRYDIHFSTPCRNHKPSAQPRKKNNTVIIRITSHVIITVIVRKELKNNIHFVHVGHVIYTNRIINMKYMKSLFYFMAVSIYKRLFVSLQLWLWIQEYLNSGLT